MHGHMNVKKNGGFNCVLSIHHLISTHIRSQGVPSSKLGSKTEAIRNFAQSQVANTRHS
jgi:hypothetical protein